MNLQSPRNMLHGNPDKFFPPSSRPFFAANEVRGGFDGAEEHVHVECRETYTGVDFGYVLCEGAFGAR